MNRSLRSRLMIGFTVTIVAGFALAAAMIFVLIRTSLFNEFDALLSSKARTLATLVDQAGNNINVEFVDHPMQEFARKIHPEYFQLWDDQGEVLARSRRLVDSDLQQAAGSLAAPEFQLITLPDGRPGRQVAVQFLPAVEGESLEHESEDIDRDDDNIDKFDFSSRRRVTLVVARETAEIDHALARLSWLMLGVSIAVITVTLSVVAQLLSHNLRPLDTLANQIAQLDEQELSKQFAVESAPSELEPVINQLNELLFRLEEAFRRERVFSADVAHELRTPLAGLRSTLEVALSQDRDKHEYRQSLVDCQEISVDTQRLVETLLSLARIESGQSIIERNTVSLEALLTVSWKPFHGKVGDKGLQIHCDGPSGITLNTDATKLRVVFSNLLGNAVDYAEPGSTIRVGWVVEKGRLEMSFANSGCLLDDEQTGRVFDRFWRADTARAATGTHAGLGLALCKKIISLLEGSITAECRDESFIVSISLNEYISRQPGSNGDVADDLLSNPGVLNIENDSVNQAAKPHETLS